MSSNVILKPAPPVVPIEPDSPNLSDMLGYADELPSTEWLIQLNLKSPRENLGCLPLSTRILKRTVDIVGASLLLTVCSPIMLITAVLVKLTSPGPIIYSQTRVGMNLRSKAGHDRRRHGLVASGVVGERRTTAGDRRGDRSFGQPFTIYKFRTMRNDAENDGVRFAESDDPRATPIGRLLRRTRIDELPQLWNILRGDMSLVGPRPERPEFMEQLSGEIPNYVDRLGLKPGLTGVAQVVNGYDNEIEGFRRKVSYDLLYLQNCCLANDLKILARTVRVVITGEGAL